MDNRVVQNQRPRCDLTGFWMAAAVWMTTSVLAANLFAEDRGTTRISIYDPVAGGKQFNSAKKSDVNARLHQDLSAKAEAAASKSLPATAKNGVGIALPARGNTRTGASSSKTAARGSLTNLAISLGLVLAVFFGLTWLLRRVNPTSAKGGIPSEVVQILGRAPLNGRQSMQLVRLGDKILLLAMSSAGTESLGEITDRDEVDAITEICRSRNQNQIAETFRETLTRVRRDRMTGQQRTVVSRNA